MNVFTAVNELQNVDGLYSQPIDGVQREFVILFREDFRDVTTEARQDNELSARTNNFVKSTE